MDYKSNILESDFNIKLNDAITVDKSLNYVGIGTVTPGTKLDVSGNISATGYITGKKSGAGGYLSPGVTITTTSPGDWYPIGTFTLIEAEDFVEGSTSYPNGLEYAGTITQVFKISWCATTETVSNNVTLTIAVQKNGTTLPMSEMGQFLKTGGEMYNISGQCIVELAPGDEVQFVIESDTAGEAITLDYFSATINQFFN